MWLIGFEIPITRDYSPCPASNKYYTDSKVELHHVQTHSEQTPLTVHVDSEPSLHPVLLVIYSENARRNLIPVRLLTVFRV
jgi:hypothetical protein